MRVVTVMAVLLLGGAATLEAQHRFQFEIGGFASFTRFDRALQLGDRIFVTDRVALRLEAGAYYAPKTQAPAGNQWAGQLVGSAGLSFFLGPSHRESPYPEVPKEKRDSILAAGGKVPEARPRGGPTYEQRSSDWQHKWYWGGEAGILVFRTNYDKIGRAHV